jgi:hypothetical protein
MTPRPLNFANIILDPEGDYDKNPWWEVLYANGEDVLASAAAYAALKLLETGWNDDAGQDRSFLLSSLDHTLDRLREWRSTFSAAVTATDIEEHVREGVALDLSRGTVSPETLRAAAEALLPAQALRAGWTPEKLAPLTRAAFEFPADTETTP